MQTRKAFSLIEIIVYVGLLAFIMVGGVNFMLNILNSNTRVDVTSELNANATIVLDQFTQRVRAADSVITGSSTFDSHPGTLTLDYPGSGTDVIFDTYVKTVPVGPNTTDIRKLRLKDGAAAYVDLTSDDVDVTNFVLTNLTRSAEQPNINLELTIDYVNPSDDSAREKSLTIETGATIRKEP